MENWKEIPGFNGRYFISDLGRVISRYRDRERILAQADSNGYRLVCLANNGANKNEHIHRLVLSNFSPHPDMKFLHVNHINGIKHDNRLENLEWVTARGNLDHARKTGLRAPDDRGENNGRAILKESDVLLIRGMISRGISDGEIAEKFDLQKAHIWKIKKRRLWKHI